MVLLGVVIGGLVGRHARRWFNWRKVMYHPVKRSSNLRCGRQNIELIMHFELHTYFLSSILKSQGSALKKTVGYAVEVETGAGADVQAAAARRWAVPQARAGLEEDRVLRRLVDTGFVGPAF